MDAHIIRQTNRGDLESWMAVEIPDDTLIAWIHRAPPANADEIPNTWVVYGKLPATLTTKLSDAAFEVWRSWLNDLMREGWPGPGRPKQYVQKAQTMASRAADKERAERRRGEVPKYVPGSKDDPEWQAVLAQLSEK